MEDMPTNEQNLRWWLEVKNLEMRDALDAGDTEAISLLGPLIAKGADHMRAICRYENSREPIRDSDSEDALVRDGNEGSHRGHPAVVGGSHPP